MFHNPNSRLWDVRLENRVPRQKFLVACREVMFPRRFFFLWQTSRPKKPAVYPTRLHLGPPGG